MEQEIETSEIRVILVNNRLDTPIVQLQIGCSQETPGISVLLLNDGTGKGVQGKTDIEAKLDYFNPSVSCYEPLIEQLNIWAMLSPRHNHGQPQIELEMENVLNINLSQSFLSLATSDAMKADHVTSSTTQFAPYLVVNRYVIHPPPATSIPQIDRRGKVQAVQLLTQPSRPRPT